MSPVLSGVKYVDHCAFTVPDLDEATAFFRDVFGAEELYRSRRGPDAEFMPLHFDVPADASLELAMMRMPPNLNIELFQWSGTGRRTEFPRHCDAGGHHLCFVVDDVDDAITRLRDVPGVRVLGHRKEVGPDSPRLAGTRWTYLTAPWGLLIEIVDRSRVVTPPDLVGPPPPESKGTTT
ncbi:VOC family protein [Actinoplanes bogorensis]|uniref:VOC family protein n=1 Tax=Paractinoplanes bogorensis TaxID=1610840 RepID=A0ABS5Z6U4_9ACTN|nr:VOC family protein [Actinoplanes bogorensis]MBU2670200.1 VOC family protein [Actinoplanes bogorensis]